MRAETYAKKFVKAVAVRAVKTFCQAMVGAIGTTAVFGEVEWGLVFSMAGMSALLSVLTSVVTGLPEVKMPEIDDSDLDRYV